MEHDVLDAYIDQACSTEDWHDIADWLKSPQPPKFLETTDCPPEDMFESDTHPPEPATLITVQPPAEPLTTIADSQGGGQSHDLDSAATSPELETTISQLIEAPAAILLNKLTAEEKLNVLKEDVRRCPGLINALMEVWKLAQDIRERYTRDERPGNFVISHITLRKEFEAKAKKIMRDNVPRLRNNDDLRLLVYTVFCLVTYESQRPNVEPTSRNISEQNILSQFIEPPWSHEVKAASLDLFRERLREWITCKGFKRQLETEERWIKKTGELAKVTDDELLDARWIAFYLLMRDLHSKLGTFKYKFGKGLALKLCGRVSGFGTPIHSGGSVTSETQVAGAILYAVETMTTNTAIVFGDAVSFSPETTNVRDDLFEDHSPESSVSGDTPGNPKRTLLESSSISETHGSRTVSDAFESIQHRNYSCRTQLELLHQISFDNKEVSFSEAFHVRSYLLDLEHGANFSEASTNVNSCSSLSKRLAPDLDSAPNAKRSCSLPPTNHTDA